jgi:hypothetical protein
MLKTRHDETGQTLQEQSGVLQAQKARRIQQDIHNRQTPFVVSLGTAKKSANGRTATSEYRKTEKGKRE